MGILFFINASFAHQTISLMTFSATPAIRRGWRCKKCDFQNEEGAKFCKSCGEALEEANNTASDNTKNKPKRTNPVIIVAIVAVIIIVVVGGILI